MGDRQIVQRFCKSAKHWMQNKPTQPGVAHLMCGSWSERSTAPHRRHTFCFRGNNLFKKGQIARHRSLNVTLSILSPSVTPNLRRNWRRANFRKLPLDLHELNPLTKRGLYIHDLYRVK